MTAPLPRPLVSMRIGSAVYGLAYDGGITIVMRMAGRAWEAVAGFPPIVAEFMPAFHKLLDMTLRAESEALEAKAAAAAQTIEVAKDDVTVAPEEPQTTTEAPAEPAKAAADKPVSERARPAHALVPV